MAIVISSMALSLVFLVKHGISGHSERIKYMETLAAEALKANLAVHSAATTAYETLLKEMIRQRDEALRVQAKQIEVQAEQLNLLISVVNDRAKTLDA